MGRAVWIVWLAGCALLLAAATAVAAAEPGPHNGFGLAAGLAAHRVPVNPAPEESTYTSAGASLAGDAQFVVNERWSLNPFLMLSLEHVHGRVDGTASNGAAGFEVRRWASGFYAGLHVGYYVELLNARGNTGTSYGPGLGASFGHESGSGFTWGVQVDAMRGFAAVIHGGLRLHVGWRWD
jgi:hypothetical protein